MAKKVIKPDWGRSAKRAKKRNKLLRALPEGMLKAAVDFIDGDGHNLFPVETLMDECGWPREAAESVCHEYKSDGTWKGTITKNGKVVDKCVGWYTLDVMYAIAHAHEVKYEGCLGRGFQSREIDRALREHFKWGPANVAC